MSTLHAFTQWARRVTAPISTLRTQSDHERFLCGAVDHVDLKQRMHALEQSELLERASWTSFEPQFRQMQ